MKSEKQLYNLETAVGHEKDVQAIDVNRRFEKHVVTWLVTSAFSNLLGALRACADFRDSIAVSRFNTSVKILFILGLITFWTQTPAQNNEFSEANNLLFDLDHLANIKADSQLNYHFIKSGSIEPGFEDDIKMDFKPADTVEERNVSTTYFSGDRQRWTPDFNGSLGNPLLTIFLQRDIYEMNRLTDGKWRHFQKRIKLAFENDAKIEPVVFTFSGKEYQGKKITINPYVNDPLNRRFKEHANKYYVFTLAEKLPGMIYQMTAVSPSPEDTASGSASKKSPLISETVTLTNVSGT